MSIAWRIVIAIVLVIITIPPAVRLLRRTGHSGWWAILAPISPLNLIGLWVLAYVRWPVIDGPKPGAGGASDRTGAA
ncbi:MAG: hypothetical protein ACREFD_13190 [Stellaceae bacterium]